MKTKIVMATITNNQKRRKVAVNHDGSKPMAMTMTIKMNSRLAMIKAFSRRTKTMIRMNTRVMEIMMEMKNRMAKTVIKRATMVSLAMNMELAARRMASGPAGLLS